MITFITILILIVLIFLAIKASFFSQNKTGCSKNCDTCSSNGKCSLNSFSLEDYYKDQNKLNKHHAL